MIKIPPNLFYDLRHALIVSLDANRENAKNIRIICTKGFSADLCTECAVRVQAHDDCADQASNFIARMDAAKDTDDLNRNHAGIHRRTEPLGAAGQFGEDVNLHDHIGKVFDEDTSDGIADAIRNIYRTPADPEPGEALYKLVKERATDWQPTPEKEVRDGGIFIGVTIDGVRHNMTIEPPALDLFRQRMFSDDGK